MFKNCILYLAFVSGLHSYAQNITGMITSRDGNGIPYVNIAVLNSEKGTQTDFSGAFSLYLQPGNYQLSISAIGYATVIKDIVLKNGMSQKITVTLKEDIQSLNEVVITSEKKESRMQRTPVAVTVLNSKDIKKSRIWSFSDINGLAPSLHTVEHGGSSSSLFINIRGVMGLHSQSAVATYVDGVYQFESFSVPLQLNNIERIEVLRGPQGTLFGRNAFGGVINIVTKRPTNSTRGSIQMDFGNYGQQRYAASYNTPLIKNKLFMNVSGAFNQREGIYTNTVTHSSFDRPQGITGRVRLRYIPSDKWNFHLNGRFERNEDYGSYPWVTSDSLLFAEPYTVGRNSRNIELRNNISASLKAGYSGENSNFHSITSIQNYRRGFPELLDTDFSAVDLIKTKNDWNVTTLSQELRVSSAEKNNSLLDWTVGTYLWTAPNGTNYNSTFRAETEGKSVSERNSRLNNTGLAFFGQASYKITKKLKTTIGLRYDYEDRKLMQERKEMDANGNIQSSMPYTKFQNSFEAFTPKVIFGYQAADKTYVYAQYARGFRAGGLNAFAPEADDIPYGPEYSDNFELGIKNTFWDNRMRINLTGFYLQQRNQQVTVIEDAFFLTKNTGDMNNLGLELDFYAIPLKGLQLDWKASFSDAEYTHLTAFSNGENRDFSGNKPLFNPDLSSFISLQYSKSFTQNISGFIRGEHQYSGAYYLNFDNVIRQSPYNMYNGRVGLQYKKYKVAFWVKNLTDIRYRTWASRVFLLNTPRTWGVSLQADF